MKTLICKIGLLAMTFILGAGCGTVINQGKAGTSSNSDTTVGGFSNQSGPTGCDLNNPFAGGTGTASDPYRIATTCHFLNMGFLPLTWGSYFVMTADLDMTGLLPQRTIDFSGFFEGQNHRIMNLTLLGPLGIFNSSTGTIQNIVVQGFSLDCSNRSRAGSIVGTNGTTGKIINASVSGTVSNCIQFAGMLVGLNQGQISHCSASGNVQGYAGMGGLVGFNSGTITTSSSVGSVTSTNSGYVGSSGIDSGVGGLVGTNVGTVSNSYAISTVLGLSDVGGLIGFNNAIITNSYAASTVAGTGAGIGGFLGTNSAGSVTNSYFDYQAAGTSSGSGIATTTSAMHIPATFVGWNTASIWNNPNASSYPSLK